jgi:hypothetical protein
LVFGWLQQCNEFLATKAKQLVIEAEGLAHFLRQHDQDFVADQVTVVVVDLLEVINIADGQPVTCAIPGRAATPALGSATQHFVTGCLAEQLEKMFVEGLSAGQPSQGVRFTIIEQRNMVPKIFDQPHQGDALIG